jgi:hypothetical protein
LRAGTDIEKIDRFNCAANRMRCEIAVVKTPQRRTQMLRENHGAQVRVSQAESLVRSARLFLLDTLESLWRPLIATGQVTMEARARVRLAAERNYIGYCSPEVDNLIDQQSMEPDQYKRKKTGLGN